MRKEAFQVEMHALHNQHGPRCNVTHTHTQSSNLSVGRSLCVNESNEASPKEPLWRNQWVGRRKQHFWGGKSTPTPPPWPVSRPRAIVERETSGWAGASNAFVGARRVGGARAPPPSRPVLRPRVVAETNNLRTKHFSQKMRCSCVWPMQ